MISFGVVIVEPGLDRTDYGMLKPISDRYLPKALNVSGCSREKTLAFAHPKTVMTVDDAMGNAESLMHMKKEMGLKTSWK